MNCNAWQRPRQGDGTKRCRRVSSRSGNTVQVVVDAQALGSTCAHGVVLGVMWKIGSKRVAISGLKCSADRQGLENAYTYE